MNNWKVEIDQIDVGQGDSYLVLFSYENIVQISILIDGGIRYFGEIVKNHVRAKIGNNMLNAVIMTHNHIDHIEGIDDIINTNNVEPILNQNTRFIIGNNINEGNLGNFVVLPANIEIIGENIWNLLELEPIQVPAPDLTILAASEFVLNGGDAPFPGDGENGFSLACLIEEQEFRVYLNSDLSDEEEEPLLNFNAANPLLENISVYTAGHHGSDTSTHLGLLAHMLPQSAIISNGNHGEYRHPSLSTIQRLSPNPGGQAFQISGFTYLSNPKFNYLGPGHFDLSNDLLEEYPRVESLGEGNNYTRAQVNRDPNGNLEISSGEGIESKFKMSYRNTRANGSHTRSTSDFYYQENGGLSYNDIKDLYAAHQHFGKEIEISKKRMQPFLRERTLGNLANNNILNYKYSQSRSNNADYKIQVEIKHPGQPAREHISIKIYEIIKEQNGLPNKLYRKIFQNNLYPEIQMNAGAHEIMENRVISRTKSHYA